MPGGFLDHRAAVLRAGAEDLADAALLDDGVGFRAQPGAHEDVLDVPQQRARGRRSGTRCRRSGTGGG